MIYKKIPLLLLIFFMMIFLFINLIPAANLSKVMASNTIIDSNIPNEKRGIPQYDYIIGKDKWPHYRIFFWVPKTATHFTPFADRGVDADVSKHGAPEKWAVVVTNEIIGNEKLVFIYVPKTFVFLYGKGFEKVIHLSYY